jgi:hypothetical protein
MGTSAAAAHHEAVLPTNLPEPVSELISRDDELREIRSLAIMHRLVTPAASIDSDGAKARETLKHSALIF